MNAQAIAEGLKKHVVEANVEHYATSLASNDNATNPVWVNAIRLYRSLGAEDQEAFMAFVRNAAIDSVSSILALADGVTELDGQDGEVVITCGSDVVSGDLQDQFLILFEEQ